MLYLLSLTWTTIVVIALSFVVFAAGIAVVEAVFVVIIWAIVPVNDVVVFVAVLVPVFVSTVLIPFQSHNKFAVRHNKFL